MRCLLGLIGTVAAFIQSLGLEGLFPSFLMGDYAPYLCTTIYPPGPVTFNLTTTASYDLTLNSTYLGTFTGTKTITTPSLPLGTHTVTITNGGLNYVVTLLVGKTQTFTHTVDIDGTACGGNCTIPNDKSWTVTANTPVQVMVINGVARMVMWTPLQGTQTFGSSVTDNYLVVQEGVGMMVRHGYRTPKGNQAMHIDLKTPGYAGYGLTPRFHPQVTLYTLTPMLDSTLGYDVSVKTACVKTCGIAIDSLGGRFVTITPTPETWSASFSAIQGNDTVILTYTDPAGSLSPQYYSININIKSRDRQLKSLSIISSTSTSNYSVYTNISALQAAVTGTAIQLNEAFSSIRQFYTLPDLPYSSSLGLVVLAEANSGLSSLYFGNTLAPYWTSSKVFIPTPGLNTIFLTIVAQDPGYNQTISITCHFLSNNTDLQTLSIPGSLWSLPFAQSVSEYAVGIPGNWGSFPLIIQTMDSKALISIYGTFVLPAQNSTHTLNTTIPLPNLSYYNQSLTVRVSAETASIYHVITLWIWKQDVCGNGRRYGSEEQCDDGNLVNGDGCSSLCLVESGGTCSGGSLTQADVCSIVNTTHPLPNCTEPGQVNCTNPIPPTNCTSLNCTDPPPTSNCTDPLDFNCTTPLPVTNCTNIDDLSCNCTDTNTTCIYSVCGNGVLEHDEECDDGNTANGDGCSDTCQIEIGNTCGDGKRDNGEMCDDGNRVNGDGCSGVCIVESGWICTYAETQQRDVCVIITAKIDSEDDPYFDYQYMGVGFGFPFVTLLLAALLALILLRLKRTPSPITLSAGLCPLILLLQLLFLLSETDLSPSRPLIFTGFSWSHLRFTLSYPPFHSRLLLTFHSSSTIHFLDYSFIFLLIAFLTVLFHAIFRVFFRQWSQIDDWAGVYFILFQLTHIPVTFYAVKSLTQLSDMSTTYDNISVTVALIAIIILFIVVLMYVLTLQRACKQTVIFLSPVVYNTLCPGIKPPMMESKGEVPASEMEINPPPRLNHSFDETTMRDNNGGEDLEEETSARYRIFSADIANKKIKNAMKSAKPQRFVPEKAKKLTVKTLFRIWVYLVGYAETLAAASVLAAGHTLRGKIVPVMVLEAGVVGYLLWQRPFAAWRYNIFQICLRVLFSLLLFLLCFDDLISELVIVSVLFLLLIFIFVFEVWELCLLVYTNVAVMKTPGKEEKLDGNADQPEVRAFSLGPADEHFTIEGPIEIPDERHASSPGYPRELVIEV